MSIRMLNILKQGRVCLQFCQI